MHTTTGLGEYLAEDDADALRIGREILAKLGWARARDRAAAPPPRYDAEELLGIVPVDYRKPYEVREVIARLVDGSDFLDFKPSYGEATVCGHAAVEGGADRADRQQRPDRCGRLRQGRPVHPALLSGRPPIVFLQNTTGYLVGVEAETSGIVKHGRR